MSTLTLAFCSGVTQSPLGCLILGAGAGAGQRQSRLVPHLLERKAGADLVDAADGAELFQNEFL